MVWQHKTLIRFKWKVRCRAIIDSLKTNITITSQGSSAYSVCTHSCPLTPTVMIRCPNDISTWQKSFPHQRVQPLDIIT